MKVALILGLLFFCLNTYAKPWQYWAKYIGPSEKRRPLAIKTLKAIENLDQLLMDQVGTPDQALALDVISAMNKTHLTNDLLKKINKDPSGFLILTINSLITPENSKTILPQYKKILDKDKDSLTAANIVSLLEPLGRLGEVLEKDLLEHLLKHSYPEVREAVLLYVRRLVLQYKKIEFHGLFAKAKEERVFQIRRMIRSYLSEVKSIPNLKKEIPETQWFSIKATRPYFKKTGQDIRIVFGYKDARPSRFVGDRHERLALVQELIRPCQTGEMACGFHRNSKDTELFLKKIPRKSGKPLKIVMRVTHSSISTDDDFNRKNPLQKIQSSDAKSTFLSGLREANVVFYNGHSRFGGGPDFTPPHLTSGGYADSEYYKTHPQGTKDMMQVLAERKMNSPKNPLDLLGVFSCASSTHFRTELKKNGVENSITSPKLYHYAEALRETKRELNSYLTNLIR